MVRLLDLMLLIELLRAVLASVISTFHSSHARLVLFVTFLLIAAWAYRYVTLTRLASWWVGPFHHGIVFLARRLALLLTWRQSELTGGFWKRNCWKVAKHSRSLINRPIYCFARPCQSSYTLVKRRSRSVLVLCCLGSIYKVLCWILRGGLMSCRRRRTGESLMSHNLWSFYPYL